MLRPIVVPFLCLGVHLAAADQQPTAGSGPDAAMAAAMAKMTTTGAQHAALARMAGTWQVAATSWMHGAGAAETSTATATMTAILGGKWIRQEYQGTWGGQPYHGLGLYGYDTVQERFVCVWVDGFSTAMMPMTGTASPDLKTITYAMTMQECPMTGKPMDYRHVQVQESDDRIVYTMYHKPAGGAESKGMELVYTRAK